MNYDEAKAQCLESFKPPKLHDHYYITIWAPPDNTVEVVSVDDAVVITESLNGGTISRWPLTFWVQAVRQGTFYCQQYRADDVL